MPSSTQESNGTNCGTAADAPRKVLPIAAGLDPAQRAETYLQCLVAIGDLPSGNGVAADLCRSVLDLVVELCPDICAARVYRVDAHGERAFLHAAAGRSMTERGAPATACLERPGDWPDEFDSNSVVVPLAHAGEDSMRAWLMLESDEPASAAAGLFCEAVAQALSAALARVQTHDHGRLRAEAATEREQRVSAFLGRVSDEIRTPLTLLLGPLEAAADRNTDPGLKTALRNGHRLKRVVDALLDFSQVDAGRIDPVLVPIDIAEMTRDVASLFDGAAASAGIVLAVDCPTLPQPVFVDRLQWEQVLINLIGNAIRFTASGEVRVTMRAHIGLMTLEVADTGTGIPPEELPHVFDRLPRSRNRDDSGFGLALVRELVRLHGGDIEASSSAGAGSRFRVCIPMMGKAARAVPHRHVTDLPLRTARRRPSEALGEALRPAPTPDATPDEPPTSSDRIIVVIDHGALRDYVAGLLSPHYQVQALGSDEACLAALNEGTPDLVLVDLGADGERGLVLVRGLRASQHGAMVPALVLSSATREFAHSDAMSAGADDVIEKPFAAAELLARVDAHMRLSRERRALHRRLVDHNRDLEAQVSLRTAALAASEAQFKAISNLVPDILWRADAQGRPEWRSEQWTRYTGDDGTSNGMDFVHPADLQETQAWLRRTIAGAPLSSHEYRIRRHDGSHHWFVARMSPLTDDDGVVQCWFGSATDIERQKLVRHALEAQVGERTVALASAMKVQQELLHRLSRSQEDERRRIARELHDSLGQYLTALKLVLSALAPEVVDPHVHELVLHLDALTTEVDREFDDIIAALRPVVLDELGLAGALPGIVADWSHRSGIDAEVLLVQVGEDRFDDEIESTLYRVTQECLTNIVKHAQARHVAVTLACRHGELHLSVEDDGAGFDPARHGGGWGLRGMAERARSIEGLLQVESTPGGGTTILVRVPRQPHAALPAPEAASD